MIIVMESYECVFIQMQTKSSNTWNIEIEKGVKQGCQLSPTLFNIGLDHLLRYSRNDFDDFRYKYQTNYEEETKVV
jgi:hypothetical protein